MSNNNSNFPENLPMNPSGRAASVERMEPNKIVPFRALPEKSPRGIEFAPRTTVFSSPAAPKEPRQPAWKHKIVPQKIAPQQNRFPKRSTRETPKRREAH
jgi:hypothetical protein